MNSDLLKIEPGELDSVRSQLRVLFTHSEIEEAIRRLGKEMSEKLQGCESLLFIVLLKGGLIFAGNLLPHLLLDLEVDYVHATRYRDAIHADKVSVLAEQVVPVLGRTVVLLDDVLDEGVTLNSILKGCYRRGAQKVYTAVLLEKEIARPSSGIQKADFVALNCKNQFLVGYGLDYKHFMRNLSGIYVLDSI